jgi:molybdate transport system regulatory protein
MKVWLSTDADEGVMGDGKWRLLCEIGKTRSLAQAAATLKISYRKAWGDISKAEATLGVELVSRARGGARGGKTCLTPAGEAWLEAYTRFREELTAYAEDCFRKHIGGLGVGG